MNHEEHEGHEEKNEDVGSRMIRGNNFYLRTDMVAANRMGFDGIG